LYAEPNESGKTCAELGKDKWNCSRTDEGKKCDLEEEEFSEMEDNGMGWHK